MPTLHRHPSHSPQQDTPLNGWSRLQAWFGNPPATEGGEEALGVECALPWAVHPATGDEPEPQP